MIAFERSLRSLGIEFIDLYYYIHRVGPVATVGAMSALVREGKVRFLGISEVALRRSGATTPPIRCRRCRSSTRRHGRGKS